MAGQPTPIDEVGRSNVEARVERRRYEAAVAAGGERRTTRDERRNHANALADTFIHQIDDEAFPEDSREVAIQIIARLRERYDA